MSAEGQPHTRSGWRRRDIRFTWKTSLSIARIWLQWAENQDRDEGEPHKIAPPLLHEKMSSLDRQTEYWDRVAATKQFTHPIDVERFGELVPRTARILDYGCGYGRTCAQLRGLEYRNVIGLDISREMIERGRCLYPDADLQHLTGGALPFPANGFDTVLLFAVLTCIPTDKGQKALISEVCRVLRPGGVLYISDFPIQDDARNQKRYAQFEPEFGKFGVFRLSEGVVVRNHTNEWLDQLLRPFSQVHVRTIEASTMNGHRCKIIQYFGRKR